MSKNPANVDSPSFFSRLQSRIANIWEYCNNGVWKDTRRNIGVNLIKTINLTVRGFLDGDLQSQACAMTYRTLLAIVPMLALLLAIGRGFGLAELLQQQLYNYFPSQQKVLSVAMNFVDSYLAQASEGIFVGVGIVFLLWTLISLLGNVEEVFNSIWNVKTSRSIWRKMTDYTAILLLLPILMICASGISIFMSSTLQRLLDFDFLTPVVSVVLDAASIVLTWLFFAGCYALIPNTKVRFSNALVAGVLAGTGYQVVQWLFVSGQMYVAKYNAIYGSFSFLPLMLIWLQLVWLITFVGAGICYSSQSIFSFSFEGEVKKISVNYSMKVELAILTVIVSRFKNQLPPVNEQELVEDYDLPPRLVGALVSKLISLGLICHAEIPDKGSDNNHTLMKLQPTKEPDAYKVGEIINLIKEHGSSGFIPGFNKHFGDVSTVVDRITDGIAHNDGGILLTDLYK